MKIIWLCILLACAKSCENDNDCTTNHYCYEGVCEHKGLFPLVGNEILGSCLILFASGLANAGGIGGGPIMVIILITLFNFNAYESVPLSQLIIFAGSLSAILIKIFLRHPFKQRPLIDFDIALLLCCPLLMGTTIGVMVNLVIPQWLILVLLTVLLGYISIDTSFTAVKIYKKESTTKTSVRLLCPDSDVLSSFSETELPPELKKIYNVEKKIMPPKSIALIILLFIFVAIVSFIRGSKNFNSIVGISFCSGGYWSVTIIAFIILLVISIYFGFFMIGKHIIKNKLGYDFDTMDLNWTIKMILIVCIAGFIAGLAAGIVGVGGGLVMNPVMLRLGLRPEVSTATSSFMVLFTATISMLQYAVAGKLNFVYGLWALSFSLVGSILGVLVLKKLVEKYKRGSILVLLLALIMGICAIIIPTYGIIQYMGKSGEDNFKSFCN
ncbi:hypothetical protein SteCoe_30894 [Stentor coeruleus]|uniref:Membrane transporter protein n=1 Tax=Stentor coeruleus TaxID=5963 RepID=A0A1R2B2H3_9CILI|nr:hypothetical protein SteCoe_30894 [Stentor coeruleus]